MDMKARGPSLAWHVNTAGRSHLFDTKVAEPNVSLVLTLVEEKGENLKAAAR